MNKFQIVTLDSETVSHIIEISKKKTSVTLADIAPTLDYEWWLLRTDNSNHSRDFIDAAIRKATLNKQLAITAPYHFERNNKPNPLVRNIELVNCILIHKELDDLILFEKIWHSLDAIRFVAHEQLQERNIRYLDLQIPLNRLNSETAPSPLIFLPEVPNKEPEEPYEEFDQETRKGIRLAHKNHYLESVTLASSTRKYSKDFISELKAHHKTEEIKFSIGCVLLPGQEALLEATITSLNNQSHSNWELLIVAFTPCSLQLNSKTIWHELGDDEDSITVLNNFLFNQQGLCALMDAGDHLESYALTLISAEAKITGCKAFYSNTLLINSFPSISKPTLLPNFDEELLRRFDYIGTAFWFNPKASQIRFDSNYPSQFYYKFKLEYSIEEKNEVHRIDELLYSHHTEGGHNIFGDEINWCEKISIMHSHLKKSQIEAKITRNTITSGLNISYNPKSSPLVSILVPTKDNLVDLKDCLDSLQLLTSYNRYEIIIIDNGSTEEDTIKYFSEISSNEKITIIHEPGPFNYSLLINSASKIAKGEIIVQLNNDTAIIDPNWLHAVVGALEQPQVGIVGIPLLFEDGTLQHAGVGIGLGSVAGHYFYKKKAETTYMFLGMTSHRVPAVTGALLAIRKELYEQVNGLDEELTTFYQDLDLCLKVSSLGLDIQYIAETAMIHKESKSLRTKYEQTTLAARKPEYLKESTLFKQRWLHNPIIWKSYSRQCDPHLNWEPDLSMIANICTTAIAPKTLLTLSNDYGAVAAYRTEEPMQELRKDIKFQGINKKVIKGLGLTELSILQPDRIILQRPVFRKVTEQVISYRQAMHNCTLGIELDDLVHEVPFSNPIHMDPSFSQSIQLCTDAILQADFLVTTTQFLADYYSRMINDIRVVNNYIDITRWATLCNIANNKERLRICWAGGSSHREDILSIKDAIIATAPFVDWVFFGMCPSEIRPFVAEIVPGVTFENYPAKLASLNIDLAIAPLAENIFNRGKSHLKIIEFGYLGVPVLCSNLDPYQGDFPVIKLNTPNDWIDAINWLHHDRTALIRMALDLKKKVHDNWILQNNIQTWKKAWLS